MAIAELSPRSRRPIAIWLLVCCALILAMVVLGGVTRLTHSGLSIVEWKPVSGIVPPLSDAEWEAAFRDYRQYPEYQTLNTGMSLDGFKRIFWLEYLHRLSGRVIGFVFLLPLLYFWRKGMIRPPLVLKLAFVFALGGLQGALGWFMVASGLIDRPDVSQYRLVAHLGLAFVIYGYLFWVALELLFPRCRNAERAGLWWATCALTCLIFVTVLAGGFVAGLDAGLVYNTFPLMGGRLIPDGLLSLDPPVRNLFENITTVQFSHRVLATSTLLATAVLWWRARRVPLPARTRTACHCLAVAVAMQASLGISTLLLLVPVPLAAAHQAGAVIVLTAALWVLHELRAG